MRFTEILKIAVILLSSLIQITTPNLDQTLPSQYGRRFVFTFLENLKPSTLKLTISALNDANVTITNAAYDINNIVSVLAGKSETITLSSTIVPSRSETKGQRAIYVKSDTNIAVYAFNFCEYSSASFIVLPIKALGRQYFLASYGFIFGGNVPCFSLVATEENTMISVSFRISDLGTCDPESMPFSDGSNFTVYLNKHEDYTVYCTRDPTGTFISSNRPIAVVSGHVGSKVPGEVTGRDQMAEMLPPVRLYGKRYVLHGPSKNRGALFRIVGSQDDTNLTTSEGTPHTINEGDFRELDLPAGESLCVQTTHPVMVIMYGKGARAGPDEYGDPFMIVVPPVELFGEVYTTDVSMLNTASFFSSVSLVMKSSYARTLGSEYDVQAIPSCLYSVATYNITDGRMDFSLPSEITYSALVYSLAPYDGNGFSLGAATKLHTLWEECTTNRCLHNGACREDLISYTCTCLPEYTGDNCEETLSFSVPMSGTSLAPASTEIMLSTEGYIKLESSASNASSNAGETFTNMYSEPLLETTSTYLETSASIQEAPGNTPSSIVTSSGYDENATSGTSSADIDRSTVDTAAMTYQLPTSHASSTSGVTFTNVSSQPIIVTSSGDDETATSVTSSIIERSTVLRSITTDDVTDATAVVTYQSCPCKCPLNYNSEEMTVLIGSLTKAIQTKLYVDKSRLSKTVRKLTSAPDDRPSAKILGGGAIALLVGFFVVFIVADFVKIVKDLLYGLH